MRSITSQKERALRETFADRLAGAERVARHRFARNRTARDAGYCYGIHCTQVTESRIRRERTGEGQERERTRFSCFPAAGRSVTEAHRAEERAPMPTLLPSRV